MRVWLPVLMMLLLVGCGGSDKTTSGPTPTSAASSVDTASAEPRGTVDPLAITDVDCRKDADGQWQTKGTLTNSGKQTRDYRVTVFIGQQTGPARTVDLDRIKSGASVPFTVRPIVAAPDGPCRLQALVRH